MNKYSIGQTVWLIHSNTVQSMMVADIFDQDHTTPEDLRVRKEISYHLYTNKEKIGRIQFIPESRLFVSKEQLIKSI